MKKQTVVLDNDAHKEYLRKDVFMRERLETFIIAMRGACAAIADQCGVPARAVEELVSESILDNMDKPGN